MEQMSALEIYVEYELAERNRPGAADGLRGAGALPHFGARK